MPQGKIASDQIHPWQGAFSGFTDRTAFRVSMQVWRGVRRTTRSTPASEVANLLKRGAVFPITIMEEILAG